MNEAREVDVSEIPLNLATQLAERMSSLARAGRLDPATVGSLAAVLREAGLLDTDESLGHSSVVGQNVDSIDDTAGELGGVNETSLPVNEVIPPRSIVVGRLAYGKGVLENGRGSTDYHNLLYTNRYAEGSNFDKTLGLDIGLTLWEQCRFSRSPGYMYWRKEASDMRRLPPHAVAVGGFNIGTSHITNVWKLNQRGWSTGSASVARPFFLDDGVIIDSDVVLDLLREGYNAYGNLCQADVPVFNKIVGWVQTPSVEFNADSRQDGEPTSWLEVPGALSDPLLQLATQAFSELRKMQIQNYERYGIGIVNLHEGEGRLFSTREKVLFVQFLSHLFAQLPDNSGAFPLTIWTTERAVDIFCPRLGFRDYSEPTFFSNNSSYHYREIQPWRFSDPSVDERMFMNYLRETFALPWPEALAKWRSEAVSVVSSLRTISQPNNKSFPQGIPDEPPDRMVIPVGSENEPKSVWRVPAPVRVQDDGSADSHKSVLEPKLVEEDVDIESHLPLIEEVQEVIDQNLRIFTIVADRVREKFLRSLTTVKPEYRKAVGKLINSRNVESSLDKVIEDYQAFINNPGIRSEDQLLRIRKQLLSLLATFGDGVVSALEKNFQGIDDLESNSNRSGRLTGNAELFLKDKKLELRVILRTLFEELFDKQEFTKVELERLNAELEEENLTIS
ncbi:MAG: hypothetical protein Q7S76_02380 [bacterium]|nr:hypothetical protein [bacterium]